MFLLTGDGFLNHCPIKPFVIYQFDMFTFFVSHTMCSILFFSGNWSEPEFWIFEGGTQKLWAIFKMGDQTRMKLWYRCKEVLIS